MRHQHDRLTVCETGHWASATAERDERYAGEYMHAEGCQRSWADATGLRRKETTTLRDI